MIPEPCRTTLRSIPSRLLSSRLYLLTALLLAIFGSSASEARAACSFRMDVLDIGQGDATFIRSPDCRTALIDGGDAGSGPIILSHLKSLGVSALDLVVVTHYHQDHLAGVVELGKDGSIAIAQVLDRGGSYSSSTFTTYSQLFTGKRKTAVVGEVYPLGSQVALKVVSVNANGLSATNENSLSVGLKLTYGQLDVLLAGDLTGITSGSTTQDIEARIAPTIGPVEIYHVDHHGSAESSNDTLLGLVQPDVSLISLGWDNTYGHPSSEALGRLDKAGSIVYMTEDPRQQKAIGSISVTSADGLSYSVTQAGASATFTARSASAQAVRTPGSVTVYRGTSTTSSVTPLTADDGSAWQTTANAKSGSYQTDWAGNVSLGTTKLSTLAVVMNVRYSTSRDQTVSLYVPSTGAWESVGKSTIGTTDQTVRHEVSNPTRYVDSSGKVLVRVTANTRSSSYKIYADALFVEWEP